MSEHVDILLKVAFQRSMYFHARYTFSSSKAASSSLSSSASRPKATPAGRRPLSARRAARSFARRDLAFGEVEGPASCPSPGAEGDEGFSPRRD